MTNPNEYRFGEHGLLFYRRKYIYNLNTALYAYLSNGRIYKEISMNINFGDIKLPSDQIYLNVLGEEKVGDQMIRDGLLELTGEIKKFRAYTYPVARITEKLEKMIIDF